MVLSTSQRLTTVFFDLGFTLINFEGDFFLVMSESYIALAKSLIQSGCKFDAPEFALRFEEVISEYYRSREIDLIERPVEEYLLQVLSFFGCTTLSQQVIQNALSAMYQVTENYWQLESDAHKTLSALKNNGYRLGLITNAANADDANRLIDKSGLRDFFEVILISAEEKIRKPDTRIYSRALTRMGSSPQSSIMVGDTLTADIVGAQNSGMQAIWLTRRARQNGSKTDAIKPDAIISSLEELLTILPPLT